MCATGRAVPFSFTQGEFGQDIVAYTAFARGREKSVDYYNLRTIPLPLVEQLAFEFAPTGIRDRLCQFVIFDHAAHIQVFDTNQPISSDQVVTGFVKKVRTLIGNSFVLASDRQPCFFSSLLY